MYVRGITGNESAMVKNTVADMRDFFSQRYGLGASNGNGPIDVVFDDTFENAAYVPPNRETGEMLVIGRDPDTNQSYASADDVIAHEYAHRVVDNIVELDHYGEPGALNESLADTFAAAIDRDDWTLGEDVTPGGLRSMANPGASQYAIETDMGVMRRPDHMDNYISTDSDHGGVHLNVGIPNKAAFLIGETLGRDAMADIYMHALVNHFTPNTGFVDAAIATTKSAAQLFGRDSREASVVAEAWKSVLLTR